MAKQEALGVITGGLKSTKGFRGVLTVAIIFDLLSAIPWVGIVFSGLGYGSLWLWLKTKGADPGLFSGDMKKLASTAAEFIAGVFGFGIVPGITMWAYFAVIEYKQKQAEERKAEMRAIKKAQKQMAKQQRRQNERLKQANRQRVKTSAYFS